MKVKGSCRAVTLDDVVNCGAKRGSLEIWTTCAGAPGTRLHRMRPWTPEETGAGAVTAGASSGVQLCGAAMTAKRLAAESSAAQPSPRRACTRQRRSPRAAVILETCVEVVVAASTP